MLYYCVKEEYYEKNNSPKNKTKGFRILFYDFHNEDSPKHKFLNEYIKTNANKKIKITDNEKNDLEHFLGISIESGNKGKYNISEIRYLYLYKYTKLM